MRFPPLPLLVLPLLAFGSVRASTLHWDGNDTDANRADGGAGIWNTLLTNWDTSAAGGANSAWTNAITPRAVFGGAAGTVTLGEPVTVAGLQFNATGYVVAAGTNRISLASAQTPVLLGNVNAATLNGELGGAGGVYLANTNPASARTLTLGGTSTNGWTGATTVNPAATLAVDGPNQGLVNTSAIDIRGGTLSYANILSAQQGLNFIADSAPLTFTGGGTFTWRPVNAGPTYTETIGAVTNRHGQASINTGTLSSGSATLVLPGPVTRTDNSATLAFSLFNGSAPTAVNRIRITGAGTTAGWVSGAASNPVIGPWATAGFSGTAPDYAVYSGDFVVASATAASAEDTWTNATRMVNNNLAAVALTGPRAVAGLRNSAGAASVITLSDGTSGHTLAADGLLNASGALFTVAPGAVAGALTINGSSGGHLFATPASGAITISAPVVDNGGPVTLVKSGASILTLSSTNSTYSGGTVLNAGTVAITSDANLGAPGGGLTFNGTATLGFTTATTYSLAATRTITLNEGAVAIFTSGNAQKNILGPVVGSGNLYFNATTTLSLRNSANTFSGTITASTAGNTAYGLEMASINDDPGVGLINLGSAASGGSFRWIKPSGGTTTFVNRQFALSGTTGGGVISSFGSTAADHLVIARDLLVTGVGNKTLTLAGTNTGLNRFAGNITDGTDGGISVVGLAKSESGTWALSGTNTYSGATTLTPANPPSQLVIQGRQALSPASNVVMSQNSSSNCTLKFLDDAPGEISLPNILTINHQNSVLNMTLFVGNNSTANGGSNPGGSTTGSTVAFSRVNFTNLNNGQGLVGIGNIAGANGYRVKFNQVDLPAFPVGFTSLATWTARFAPLGAPLIIAGPVRQLAGNASPFGTQPVLSLDGTNANSRVDGDIQDPSDLGVNALAKPLQVTKTNGGTWTLSGTNTFSGGLTLSGATANSRLNLNSPAALGTGTFTVSGGNNARIGNTSGAAIINTNNNAQVWSNDFSFVGPNDLNLGTGAVTLGGNRVLTVATNTVLTVGGVIGEPVAARGLNKQGTGTLVLGGANSYTGATAVNAGKLLVHGDQSAASGAITVAANATLGGRGTLGGNVTVSGNGRLEFRLTTPAGGHDRLELAAGRTFTFSGASALTIVSSGGAAPGRYTLVTAPGGFTGTAPASVSLPLNWVASVSIDGNDLVLDVTSTGTPGGYGDWQTANGTAQPVNGDHDGDGVPNGIEWFVHGPNASATADTAPGVFSSLGGLTVTWTKHPDFSGAYGVNYVVESADVPQGPWTPEVIGGRVSVVGQEVRFTFAAPLPNRKYAQLKVTGP